MQLEVTVNSDDPFYVSLEGKKALVIGSSQSGDVVIPHEHMSRKHLQITVEENAFFVEDLGSTNGTFINDERIPPKTKLPFTTFFPLVIGNRVQISLIINAPDNPMASAAEAQPKEWDKDFADRTRTRVASASELRAGAKATPGKPGERGKGRRPRRGEAPIEDNRASQSLINFVAFVILVGTGYYAYTKKVDSDAAKAAQVQVFKAEQAKRPVAEVRKTPARPEDIPLIADSAILSRPAMEAALAQPKCQHEDEKLLCDLLPNLKNEPWGVRAEGNTLLVFIDIDDTMIEAFKLAPMPAAIKNKTASVTETDQYFVQLWNLTAMLYLVQNTGKVDFSKLFPDKALTFVFCTLGEKTEIGSTFTLTPQALEVFKGVFLKVPPETLRNDWGQFLPTAEKHWRMKFRNF